METYREVEQFVLGQITGIWTLTPEPRLLHILLDIKRKQSLSYTVVWGSYSITIVTETLAVQIMMQDDEDLGAAMPQDRVAHYRCVLLRMPFLIEGMPVFCA